MKTVLILQARMNSSRLPGKILMPLLGNIPLIGILLNRLKKAKKVDKIIVATSDQKEDEVLIKYLKKHKYSFFRGSEKDTLERFYRASKKFKAHVIIRITSDCPLSDPKLIDKFITKFFEKKPDYLANTFNVNTNKKLKNFWNAYPDGFDVEIFNFKLLESVYLKHKKIDRKEGAVVGYFLRKNLKFRKKVNILNEKLPYLIKNKIKLSVDTRKDFRIVKSIFDHFYPKIDFTFTEVIDYLKMKVKIKKNDKGLKLWDKANKLILGGNMILSKNPNLFLPNKWPTYYSKSKGYNVWDLNGKKYIDISLMGVGTNILGYSNSEVDSVVRKTIRKGNLTSLNCPEEVELAERLVSIHPWSEKVKLARSGGEANAIAIRIARANTNKHNVAFCGYHGWHDWYLSSNLNNSKNLDQHLIPGLNPIGVNKALKKTSFSFEYNNFNQLKKIVNENDIGIIKMEVCRSTEPNEIFLNKVRKFSSKKGIILIFDECTSGFRENLGGLHQKINIIPEIAILGKALGNGYAINAVIGKKNIMDAAKKSFISSTFWSERIGPTAAIKTLEIMEKNKSWKTITNLGKYLIKIWEKLSKRHKLSIEINGLPSLAKFKFKNSNNQKYKTYITQRMLEKGYLASNGVYMSTSHNLKILKKYEEILDEIFFEISLCEKGDLNIDYLLNYPVSTLPFGRVN